METSGQPESDGDPMGGGKMKQRNITKRQVALTLLEMCHGYLILFAISACVAVCSGNIRAWKRTVCTDGIFIISGKCRTVSSREESNTFLAVWYRCGASDRRFCDDSGQWCAWNLDRDYGNCCSIFLFLCESVETSMLAENTGVSVAWN